MIYKLIKVITNYDVVLLLDQRCLLDKCLSILLIVLGITCLHNNGLDVCCYNIIYICKTYRATEGYTIDTYTL